MDRGRLISGSLCHPFCRPPRGGHESDIQSFRLKVADHSVDGRRLTRSRASGQNHDSIFGDGFYGFFLFLRKGNLKTVFNLCDHSPHLGNRHIVSHIEIAQHPGRVKFQIILGRPINSCLVLLFFYNNLFLNHHVQKMRLDHLLFHLKHP